MRLQGGRWNQTAAPISPPGRALKDRTDKQPKYRLQGGRLQNESGPTDATRAGSPRFHLPKIASRAGVERTKVAQVTPPGRAHYVSICTQDVATNKYRSSGLDVAKAGFPSGRVANTRYTASSFSPQGVCRGRRRVRSRPARPAVCLQGVLARVAHFHLNCSAGCCVAHGVTLRGIVVATARLLRWANVKHVFVTCCLCRRSCHARSPP